MLGDFMLLKAQIFCNHNIFPLNASRKMTICSCSQCSLLQHSHRFLLFVKRLLWITVKGVAYLIFQVEVKDIFSLLNGRREYRWYSITTVFHRYQMFCRRPP